MAAALQHILSKIESRWCHQRHPLVALPVLYQIHQSKPLQRARLMHLQEQEVKGSHARFDIPLTQKIWHSLLEIFSPGALKVSAVIISEAVPWAPPLSLQVAMAAMHVGNHWHMIRLGPEC